MNLDGMSEATLEKFIACGFIKDFDDLFHLDRYEEQIKEMDGFGEKSYQKIMQSVEAARQTTLPKLIYSLGIPGIGLANARVICQAFGDDVEKMIHAEEDAIAGIQGIGPVLAKAFVDYFKDEPHVQVLEKLLKEVTLPEKTEAEPADQIFAGMTFVITGSVHHFANRREVKEVIESKGGKVTGKVTKNTNFLINNDVNSTSSKNKDANKLGVKIISEDEFVQMLS